MIDEQQIGPETSPERAVVAHQTAKDSPPFSFALLLWHQPMSSCRRQHLVQPSLLPGGTLGAGTCDS
eukprot:9551476-Karenia_brevis.AAC.1